jgi:hypothetical protein
MKKSVTGVKLAGGHLSKAAKPSIWNIPRFAAFTLGKQHEVRYEHDIISCATPRPFWFCDIGVFGRLGDHFLCAFAQSAVALVTYRARRPGRSRFAV